MSSKICCIENGVVSPKASSCSMILRSACSHGHSHRNSFVKERSSSSSQKRKHNSSITSKSPQNGYSLLNGLFHESLEINHKTNQKVVEVNSSIVSCAKELNFSQLSLSDSQHSYILNNLNHVESSSDYCSATESDINSSESLNATLDMNTRRYVRSPHPSVRSLSDSEGESDVTVERISRLTRTSVSKNHNANQNFQSHREGSNLFHNSSYVGNHSYIANSHSSKYTGNSDDESAHSFMTNSSHLATTSVKSSLIDRIRVLFWNYACVNFLRVGRYDYWILSRLHKFRGAKMIPFLLLPLIFCLVLGAYESSQSPSEFLSPVTDLVSTVISSFFSFLSSIFSFVYITFTRKTVEDGVSESSNEAGLLALLPNLSNFGALFSGLFYGATVEKKHDLRKHNHHLKEENLYVADSDSVSRSSQSTAEELLALNKLKAEMKELKLNFEQMEADKLMYQKILNDISDLHLKFESMSKTLTTKENDSVERYQKEQNDRDEKILAVTNEYKNHMDILKSNLKVLENKLGVYEDLKKCCYKNQDLAALIERNIMLAFKEILDGDVNSKYNFFSEWLNSKFFNKEKLMQEINTALRQHKSSYTEAEIDFSKVIQVVESTVMKHVDTLKRNLSEFNSYSYSTYEDFFSEDKIRKIVKEAIMLYDADKIGQVDYALESGGGSVLGTRCSETYVEKYGKISLFGVPFWTDSNSPRTAIQPDVQPGRCWAFKGSQGFLVLQLSATIYPTGFTLEHIPVSLSPAGSIDSAPKNFSIWGLDSEKDNKGNLLGEYFYDINGDPLQYFSVKIPSSKPYSYIELQIHSNHGNMEYTCLYRFRVHGKRSY